MSARARCLSKTTLQVAATTTTTISKRAASADQADRPTTINDARAHKLLWRRMAQFSCLDSGAQVGDAARELIGARFQVPVYGGQFVAAFVAPPTHTHARKIERRAVCACATGNAHARTRSSLDFAPPFIVGARCDEHDRRDLQRASERARKRPTCSNSNSKSGNNNITRVSSRSARRKRRDSQRAPRRQLPAQHIVTAAAAAARSAPHRIVVHIKLRTFAVVVTSCCCCVAQQQQQQQAT